MRSLSKTLYKNSFSASVINIDKVYLVVQTNILLFLYLYFLLCHNLLYFVNISNFSSSQTYFQERKTNADMLKICGSHYHSFINFVDTRFLTYTPYSNNLESCTKLN